MDDEAGKQLLHRKNMRLVWILVAFALIVMMVTMLKT